MAKDKQSKLRMQVEFDARMKAKECNIRVNDQVNKTTPAWDPDPYVVTHIKGSMVTVKREGRVLSRNSSFFKLFHSELMTIEDDQRPVAPNVEPVAALAAAAAAASSQEDNVGAAQAA